MEIPDHKTFPPQEDPPPITTDSIIFSQSHHPSGQAQRYHPSESTEDIPSRPLWPEDYRSTWHNTWRYVSTIERMDCQWGAQSYNSRQPRRHRIFSPVAQTYCKPISSNRAFWTMKVATVFDNSLPLSIILRLSGIYTWQHYSLHQQPRNTAHHRDSPSVSSQHLR
jgi:hypothetical protein